MWWTCAAGTGFRTPLFTSGEQSMAAWMFLTPCARASLRRRTPGSGRWWPSRRWISSSLRMSCQRMSCQKTSEGRLMQAGRAVCPKGIHGLPAAALCDTWCQPQLCTASSSTGPGRGPPPTPAGTGRGTTAFRRSAAARLVAA